MADDKLQDAMNELKAADRERWLTLLFANDGQRPALTGLYGVSAEIAKVPAAVSEPMLGRIRLQWWRESFEAAATGNWQSGRGPAALDLLAVPLAQGHLAPGDFEPLLVAQEDDLEESGAQDWASLEAYADATAGQVSRLALRLLMPKAEPALVSRVTALGHGSAFAALLRAIPFYASRRRSVIPLRSLAEAGLGLSPLAEGDYAGEDEDSQRFRSLVAELAARAGRSLEAARGPLPKNVSPLFLPFASARRHLRLTAKLGHRVFDPRLAAADPLAAWRLTVAALRMRVTGRLS